MNQSKKRNLNKLISIPFIIVMILLVILSQKILPAYANISSSQVTVIASVLNVRETPNISSKIIGLVHRGDTFDVIQTKDNWDQVKLSENQIGWVNHTYVTSTKTFDASVNVNVLNVRQQPGFTGNIIGKLKLGAKVNVLEEQAEWTKIKSASGIQGWVYTSYITRPSQNPQHVPTAEANQKSPIFNPATDNNNATQQAQSTSPANVQTIEPDRQHPLEGKTIVLDPGHGGMDAGTTSINGAHEKDLTLATAKAVEQKLKKAGTNIIMSRTDDTFISLQQRSNLSNQNHADAFISFHYNWSNNPAVSGLTDFYYNESKDSNLASTILNEVVKTTGLTNVGTRFDDLYVLRNNSRPSVLIELGFLSNKQDESAAERASYNEEVAQGVYLGLIDYFSNRCVKGNC